MSKLFKRTKILATIGPATNSAEKVEEVIMAGVNGCRLNCSHGSNEERDQQIQWIREAATKKGRSVAILQDLAGTEAAGSFQQRFQFFQRFIGGSLCLSKTIGIEANQHRPFLFCFKI